MRRPLTRHLSEGGGGGATGDGAGRRQRSSPKEGGDERGYTWACRDYGHHLSFGDLLKTPTSLPDCRGRTTISPEKPRNAAIHR
ncbi:hypothetical protein HN011_006635 [Eciton burchellii]|nr:hypothetical protein HN011_006635 [Eciton burchellii]